VTARTYSSAAALVIRAACAIALIATAGVMAAPAATADPGSTQSLQWWLGTLGMDQVWQISKGEGVTVALLDTGVDGSDPNVRGALVRGFDAVGAGDGRSDTDSEYHGTRLAAEIAGRGVGDGVIGIAPRAKIMPVIVPSTGVDDNTVAALNRLSAMKHPPQVVNMSYGTEVACPDAVQAAVKKAVDKGMILVAAAGNQGATTNGSAFPANCAGVIAVGAYGAYGADGLDIKPWKGSERQPYVTLSAPGIHLVTHFPSDPALRYATGTSDSAAIVSGSIALVRAHFPAMSARQIVARMIATARQFQGAQGTHNNVFGWGAARPRHALTDHVSANAPNPVYDALDKLGSGSPSSSASASASSSPTESAGTSAASGSTKSSGSGVLIGALVAVVVVALIIVSLLVRGRRTAARLR
jgi:hypothetical protein